MRARRIAERDLGRRAGRSTCARTLGPLRRGTRRPGPPVGRGGRFWWACADPGRRRHAALAAGAGAVVTRTAWGAGADWLLERVPALLGAGDDWSGLDLSGLPRLRGVRAAVPGCGCRATGLVMDALVPAVLEQKVTGEEARRSWRLLLHRFGTPRARPASPGMRVPPAPRRCCCDIPTWDWHRLGVDLKRQRAIRAAAAVALRLEECVAWRRTPRWPGCGSSRASGEWTAAETAQRASATRTR